MIHLRFSCQRRGAPLPLRLQRWIESMSTGRSGLRQWVFPASEWVSLLRCVQRTDHLYVSGQFHRARQTVSCVDRRLCPPFVHLFVSKESVIKTRIRAGRDHRWSLARTSMELIRVCATMDMEVSSFPQHHVVAFQPLSLRHPTKFSCLFRGTRGDTSSTGRMQQRGSERSDHWRVLLPQWIHRSQM